MSRRAIEARARYLAMLARGGVCPPVEVADRNVCAPAPRRVSVTPPTPSR